MARTETTVTRVSKDEINIKQHFGAIPSDETVLATVRSTKEYIMALDQSLHLRTLTICDLLPAVVLRHRATRDVSGLIAQLRDMLRGLDAHLKDRIQKGTLERVVFTTRRGGASAAIAGDERPRVRQFFEALGDVDIF